MNKFVLIGDDLWVNPSRVAYVIPWRHGHPGTPLGTRIAFSAIVTERDDREDEEDAIVTEIQIADVMAALNAS